MLNVKNSNMIVRNRMKTMQERTQNHRIGDNNSTLLSFCTISMLVKLGIYFF